MSSKRKKKRSPAKAVIGASLEIAQEIAHILEAAKSSADHGAKMIPAPTAVTK